ncbi:MAG: DUF4124 domain-containing protein [Pseudomonadota bacterium]|nr:DUF4124 domain-containing protein [Pseudomonadota bacterium]
MLRKQKTLPRRLAAAGILAGLILSTAPAPRADIYKWKDEDGNVHYTATPPPAGEYEVFGRSSTPPAAPAGEGAPEPDSDPAAAEPPPDAEPPPAPEIQDEPPAAIQPIDDQAAQRDEYCQRARTNLDILENYEVVSRPDDQGQPVVLDDEQRQQALRQARKDVEYFCDS